MKIYCNTEELAAAIRWANWKQIADLIITGRGGGSVEDLWAFNEESVARAIFGSGIPVISAVGHEPDVTISDFVADLRAATPSNAAELAVPDQNELAAALMGMETRLARGINVRLERERRTLERIGKSRVLTDPQTYFREKRMLLDYQGSRLTHGLEKSVSAQRQRLGQLAAALDAMSPLKVLGRGYALAQKEDGRIVASVKDLVPGERFELRVADGSLSCRTEE